MAVFCVHVWAEIWEGLTGRPSRIEKASDLYLSFGSNDNREEELEEDEEYLKKKRIEQAVERIEAIDHRDVQKRLAAVEALISILVKDHYADLKRPKVLLDVASRALAQVRGGEMVGQMIHDLRNGQRKGDLYHPIPLVPKNLTLGGIDIDGRRNSMFVSAVGRKLANQMEDLAAEAGVQLTLSRNTIICLP